MGVYLLLDNIPGIEVAIKLIVPGIPGYYAPALCYVCAVANVARREA
jgi:hypothetical protein